MMCGTYETESSMKTLNPAVARVLKRLHYPLDVILTCVRWYVAYPLSLRHVEEMMLERAVSVDHSTVHRWAIKLLPVLEKAFRSRKRAVGRSWRMDETYSTPSQHSPPTWVPVISARFPFNKISIFSIPYI